MDLQEKLSRLGISGNLFTVYLSAINMGAATVACLAQRTGLARTTTYDAVARLEEEGLVEFQGSGRKRMVVARDPSVLMEYVAARRQMVTDMLPQLRSMYNHVKGKPQIRFYEGLEGMRTALWDSLRDDSLTLRATFSMYEIEGMPGLDEIERYRQARVERKIFMRVIRSRSRDTRAIWPSSAEDMREVRFTPPALTLAMTTLIYGNTVALMSSKRENYGLIIESEEYAAHQGMLFEAVWMASEPAPPAASQPSADAP
ncbi:TrmB family transcriptional regulator [Parapusillimonas granuli]|uniref:TrmB family transcriptional regulator n=1 Tax=Parapusillimonas granuli TaxID=380911 RepID=UPI0017E85BDF|nr:helix-turn-helix domain-containing protein [Parapusillimonas granuli]MBB5214499.1 sugar-specific transcriptional regulator TrmB [Parapusillimonas granuli]MEB2398257.1 helix-turn-helix domain-containing protein [Alcaligenaceae bacterium]